MSCSFSEITVVKDCAKWNELCDRKDVHIKDGKRKQWTSFVGEYMRDNYLPDYAKRLEKSLLNGNTRLGLSLEQIIKQVVPSRETTRKGDFGEAVCCLTFEKLCGFSVPYYKWANKSHFELPERGIDVMAFEFNENPEDDILYPTEVKYRVDTQQLLNVIKEKQNGIITKISSLKDLKICNELTFILMRLEYNDDMRETFCRVFDFFNRFIKNPKRIYNSTFFLVDSAMDLDKCITALSPLTKLSRELKSYNHVVTNLKSVMDDVFEVVTN